jgi:hypothetical protein
VLRNPPFIRGFWGKSNLRQGRPPDKDRGCLGTHPSKEHFGGSPISARDAPMMRTGWCLGTYPSKGHSRGSPISDRDAPPDKERGCLRTHPSKGHSRGGLISDRDSPLIRTRHPPLKRTFWGKSDLRLVHPP